MTDERKVIMDRIRHLAEFISAARNRPGRVLPVELAEARDELSEKHAALAAYDAAHGKPEA